MAEPPPSGFGPAFYARPKGDGGWRDWWAVLHPPYTAWHLSYVVLGACVAPTVDAGRLAATLAAFLLAVGVTAHALDERNGRPLRTGISDRALDVASGTGLLGAIALGVAGLIVVGPGLAPYIVVGAVAVVGYNLELFGGRLHNAFGFAAAWGAFPVLTAHHAQAGGLSVAAVLAATAAFCSAAAQRALSTEARFLRRRVRAVDVRITLVDGTQSTRSVGELLAPFEAGLRWLVRATVALAAALLAARFGSGWR